MKEDTKDISALFSSKLRRRFALGDDLKKELLKYCKIMQERFHGVIDSDIKKLVFQLGVRNNIEHSYSKGAVGKKWLKNFLRKTHSVSLSRAKEFSTEMVFNLLQPQITKLGINPAKVFNVQETGISVVQLRRSKVMSLVYRKQIETLLSEERGELMTLVTCLSASGTFVPLHMVFPRKNMKQEPLNGCRSGTIARCHPSGWIQVNSFF